MKYRYLLLTLAAASLSVSLRAQGTTNDMETDLGIRTSVGIDYKVTKGFHLNAEYEMRTGDNVSKIGRHQISLGGEYKIAPWLKAGLSYTYFENQGKKHWKPRHRVSGDLTFGWKAGDWKLSVKEQLRLTHKDDINVYPQPRNSLALKSRFKAQYNGWGAWRPYGLVELRNALNDASVTATWSTADEAYGSYEFGGYSTAYVNRVRGGAGLLWKINKQNSIDFYALLDYCYDKDIDVSSDYTTLISLTWDQTLCPIIGIGYKFSF